MSCVSCIFLDFPDKYFTVNVHTFGRSVDLQLYPRDSLLLLDSEPIHEPAVLLFGDGFGLLLAARPLQVPIGEPLVAEQPAVSLIEQGLHTVIPAAAKQEDAAWFCRVNAKRAVYESGQAVNPFSQIRIAGTDVNPLESDGIIQHGEPPQSPWLTDPWEYPGRCP